MYEQQHYASEVFRNILVELTPAGKGLLQFNSEVANLGNPNVLDVSAPPYDRPIASLIKFHLAGRDQKFSSIPEILCSSPERLDGGKSIDTDAITI